MCCVRRVARCAVRSTHEPEANARRRRAGSPLRRGASGASGCACAQVMSRRRATLRYGRRAKQTARNVLRAWCAARRAVRSGVCVCGARRTMCCVRSVARDVLRAPCVAQGRRGRRASRKRAQGGGGLSGPLRRGALAYCGCAGARGERKRATVRMSRARLSCEDAFAPTATRREGVPPTKPHHAESASRRHEQRRPSATPSRMRRRGLADDRERQCGAAGSGAARAARRRPPPERTRPRRQPRAESALPTPPHHAESKSRRRKERRPSVAPSRARRHGRAGDGERQRGAAGGGIARAARWRPPPERSDRADSHAQKARRRPRRATPRA